jgi:hypothetical protein
MGEQMSRGIEHWLVGVAGRKGSGKDTVASSFKAGSRKMKFAGPLKEFTARSLKVSPSSLEDRVIKETAFASPVEMDLFVGEMRESFKLDVKPRGFFAHNPREFMQYLGTEYVRGIDPEYWVKRLISDYWRKQRISQRLTVVTDVRFDNEVAALRAAGGVVVRIDRLSLEPPVDPHPSEALDFNPDFVIVNWHDDVNRLKSQFITIVAGLAS